MSIRSPHAWVFFLLAAFFLSYFIWYPELLLIADEQSYFNRALHILSGHAPVHCLDALGEMPSVIESQYPLGTSMCIVPFLLLEHKFVFLSGPLFLALSILISWSTLRQLRIQHPWPLALFLLYLPCLVLSRSIMSEMPSLLLVAMGVYFYFAPQTLRNTIGLAIAAGASIAFRETNLMILGPLLVHRLLGARSSFLCVSVVCFLLASCFRWIPAYWLYDNAFFIKSSYPFSLAFIPQNLGLYAVIWLFLFPLGVLWVWRYDGPSKHLLRWLIIVFVLLHLCYGYNASAYSGWKMALLLNGRFFIPLLPVLVIMLAKAFPSFDARFEKTRPAVFGLLIACLLACAFVHYTVWKRSIGHQRIAQAIYTDYGHQCLVFDAQHRTAISRYINPFFGPISACADLYAFPDDIRFDHIKDQDRDVFVVLAHRSDSAEKQERARVETDLLQAFGQRFAVQLDQRLESGDGTTVHIYRLQQAPADQPPFE